PAATPVPPRGRGSDPSPLAAGRRGGGRGPSRLPGSGRGGGRGPSPLPGSGRGGGRGRFPLLLVRRVARCVERLLVRPGRALVLVLLLVGARAGRRGRAAGGRLRRVFLVVVPTSLLKAHILSYCVK